jgi:hypothetical protein
MLRDGYSAPDAGPLIDVVLAGRERGDRMVKSLGAPFRWRLENISSLV